MTDVNESETNSVKLNNNRRPSLVRSNVTQMKLSNRHDIPIFWIDPKMHRNRPDTRRLLEAFNGMTLELFNDLSIAMARLQRQKETSLLIISGKCAARSLKSIVALRCIDSVVIFCASPERYRQLVHQWSTKILACVNTEQELIDKVHAWIDLKCQIHFYTWDIKRQTNQSLIHSTEALFLAHYVLVDLIRSMADYSHMVNMLKYCLKYYSQTKDIASQIEEFQLTYIPSKALHWYTRDSFIHKMVNRALRSFDRSKIEIIAFYIRDLCDQLSQYRLNEKSTNLPTCVYHGLAMTRYDINRIKNLKRGSFISMNGFLSTSRSRQVAENFAKTKRNSLERQILVEVLFEITLNLEDSPVVCADVGHLSAYPDEEEVLFTLGSVFIINDVCYDIQTEYWMVRLSLATDDDYKSIGNELKSFQSTLAQDRSTELMDQLLAQSEKDDTLARSEERGENFSLFQTIHLDSLWSSWPEGYRAYFHNLFKSAMKSVYGYLSYDESELVDIDFFDFDDLHLLCSGTIQKSKAATCVSNHINNADDRFSHAQHEPVLFFCLPTISQEEKAEFSSIFTHQYRRFIDHHLTSDEMNSNLEQFHSILYISEDLPHYMKNKSRIKFYSITPPVKMLERLNNQLLEDLALLYSKEAFNLPKGENHRCVKKCLLNKASECYKAIAEIAEATAKRYESAE